MVNRRDARAPYDFKYPRRISIVNHRDPPNLKDFGGYNPQWGILGAPPSFREEWQKTTIYPPGAGFFF